MAFNFKKVNQTISGNSQTVNPSLSLNDILNFDLSSDSVTQSYTDQRQSFQSNQQTSNVTNLFAINSSGVSANSVANPAMSTTPTTTNSQKGGNAGINPQMVIIGIVAILGIYLGIQYLGK